MYIDKFKKDDHYEDEDGCYHEDAESVITASLGFCGCGSPDLALKYVKQSLELVQDYQDLEYEGWEVKKNKFFNNNEGSEYFMWYFLNDKGLTEHGSCVPGWLSESGKELLSDLKEMI